MPPVFGRDSSERGSSMAFDPKRYAAGGEDRAPAKMASFDPKAYASGSDEPGILERAGMAVLENVVVPVGRAIDRYTGAPSRAALNATIEGQSPVSAFANQFGQEPEKAPTGKEIANKLGVSNTSLSEVVPSIYSETGEGLALKKGGFLDPTASGAAGLGVDIASDWTNLVPGALALKTAYKAGTKGTATAAKIAAKSTAAATDIATGTKAATKSLQVAGDAAERAKSFVDSYFNPKQAPNFQKSIEIAKKNQIDPAALSSSVEFGKTSRISRLERTLREGPAGEHLLDQYGQGYAQISDAVGRKIGKVSGGTPINQVQAGELIQQGFKGAQDALLDGADITYKKVQQYAPGLYINREELAKFQSSLNGVERYAKGLARRGVTGQQKAEGEALLQAVNAVRATKGSFKQSAEALKMLGKAAFKDKPVMGIVSPDVQKLRDLYFDLSGALVNTVKKDISPEFAKELVENNAAMSSFFKDRSLIMPALDSRKAGEQVFQRFILNGDTKSIGVLKSRLKPEEIAQLKGAFLQSLIRPTEEGLVNFNQLANAIRQKKNQVAALFDPKEIQELGELVRLGQDYGPAIMSTSGTGASNSFRNLMESTLTGFADEKALNAMKSKARGGATAAPKQVATSAPSNIPSVTIDTKKIVDATKRGPFEKRLKSAQSVAPSNYDERKAKGESKWAQSGLQKLGIQDRELASTLLQDPQGKRLLIEASDLKPGTPAMKKVMEKIEKGWVRK